MDKTITMTTKGTFTLPVTFRKKLDINVRGEKLVAKLDEANLRIIISKPTEVKHLHKKIDIYIKAKKPLINTAKFYQKRKVRI